MGITPSSLSIDSLGIDQRENLILIPTNLRP